MFSLAHFFLPHESNNQRAKLLHPSSLLAVLVVYLLFQITLSRLSSTHPQILGYASQIPPAAIIELTNKERTSRGLSSLTLNPSLTQAASRKAADMFAKDYWAHVSPTGTQPWFFITDSGYSYRYAGENLARDFSDSQSVVSAWMASPSHRENLLNPRYRDIGVAVVDGRLTGRDTTLVVQMFGTRLAAAPEVSQASSFTVQAQSESNLAPATSLGTTAVSVDPFRVTQTFTLVLLGIFAFILAVDIIVVNYRRISRWTSKSAAHLAFVLFILIAAATILKGQIL